MKLWLSCEGHWKTPRAGGTEGKGQAKRPGKLACHKDLAARVGETSLLNFRLDPVQSFCMNLLPFVRAVWGCKRGRV